MATSKGVLDYLIDQIGAAGAIRAQAMFGEYTLYCDEKPVAVVCGDRLFVKPTKVGSELAGDVKMASPYPSAKPRLLIPEEYWDDQEYMCGLIAATAAALPMPKPKRAKPTNKK